LGRVDALVLGLFRGLPEKQIRADRRAQDSDDGDDIILLPYDAGYQRAIEYLAPRYAHHEHRRDISEERQGQPFQEDDVALVAGENLECRAEHHEEDDVNPA